MILQKLVKSLLPHLVAKVVWEIQDLKVQQIVLQENIQKESMVKNLLFGFN
jgi:hypothetical protein